MELGANISKFLEGNHFTGRPNTYTKIGQLQESKTNSGCTSVACQNILVPVQCQRFSSGFHVPQRRIQGLKVTDTVVQRKYPRRVAAVWAGGGSRLEVRREVKRGGKSLAKDLRPDNFSLSCRQHQQDKSKFPTQGSP